jgi:hypothetical protein
MSDAPEQRDAPKPYRPGMGCQSAASMISNHGTASTATSPSPPPERPATTNAPWMPTPKPAPTEEERRRAVHEMFAAARRRRIARPIAVIGCIWIAHICRGDGDVPIVWLFIGIPLALFMLRD